MHLQRNATQRNATQRNATQRIPQLYLNNNFKFYIFQFFRAFSFLSVFICFAKIISFIKEKQNLCSFFYREKRTKKAASFVKRSKTTPFRIRNSLVKTMSLRVRLKPVFDERSNLFGVDCHDFLRSLAMTIENLFAIFNYAFSYALKNKFEIISQSDYGFCYKNYFFNRNQVFRNSYDFGERFGRNLNYSFGKDYNCNFKKNCDYDFEKNCSGGFGKNHFGNCNFGFDFGNEIYGIGNSLAGFLFNRKIKK